MWLEGRGVVLKADFSENGLDDREISPVGANSKVADVSLASRIKRVLVFGGSVVDEGSSS
jgi:hypothetical protein